MNLTRVKGSPGKQIEEGACTGVIHGGRPWDPRWANKEVKTSGAERQ